VARLIQADVRRPWIRRRRWRIALVAGAATLVFGVALGWLLYPRLAAGAIRDKVVSRLEARLGRQVTVGSVDVDRSGHAVLRRLEVRGDRDGVEPLLRIDEIRIDYSFWASLHGSVDIDRVVVDGLQVTAARAADGSDNFRDVLDLLRGRAGAGGGGRSSGLRARVIEVASGSAVLRDDRAGVVMSIGRIGLDAERGGQVSLRLGDLAARTTVGPKTAADEILITAELDKPRETAQVVVSGGAISLWSGMSLTGITGSMVEDHRPGRLVLDFSGGYGGAQGRLWQASGWVDPEQRSASIALNAERFTFDRIAPVLARSAVIDYDQTSVDAALQIDYASGRAALDGHFQVSGLNVSHPMLASKPVRNIELGGEIAGSFDDASRTLIIDRAKLHSRGVDYRIEGSARMPGGIDPNGVRRERWHVGGRFDIPALPCQRMLDGIPDELVPYLDGAELAGTFDTALRFDIDWADLQATQLGGRVGIWGCRVRRMPAESSVARLRNTFTHYVEVERDNWMAFDVGPSNPDFVPLAEVSPYLFKSFTTTEDGAFYSHRGFIKSEFRTALVRNLEKGYFSYGASSITMQMVKNVMLYSEKTLSRKLQELFLTWYVETGLSKERILEIYVNVIEYGPGLYGIGPAARRYFGKHPRDLNPVEAAFFSSILPSPKLRYRQYCEDKLSKYTESKIPRILDLMLKRGKITQEEYDLAKATPLVFDRAGAGSLSDCKAQVYRAVKNARPTNPMKK
jgi:hypothetical protein